MAGASDIRAGRAFVELVVRDKLAAGLNAAAAKLKSYSGTFAAAGGALLGGAMGALGGMTALAADFGATGAQLDDLSARSGMSVEALSELGYAAEQSGTNLEAVEKANKKLSKTITDAADGSQSAREGFAALGLSYAELAAMNPDQQFTAVANHLAGIEDPTRKAALAQELLGKSGTELVPMLGDMQALREEAKALGLTVSGETASKAAVLDDSLASLKSVAKDTLFEIGGGLAPSITALVAVLKGALVPVNAFIESHGDLLQVAIPVAAAVAGVGVSLLAIAGGLQVGAFLLSGLATALGVLTSPVTLIVAAMAGGVYAWTRFSASGQAALAGLARFFGPLLATAKQTLGGISDAFRAGNLQLAAQIAVAGLKSVLLGGLQQILALLPDALGPLGDWLAKMASQLAAGRWSELGQTAMAGLRFAWQAGIAGLRSLWGSFTRGVVSLMATAARMVAEIWTKAVTGIANGILKLASSNAAMGKMLAPVLGVNMFEQRQKSEAMEPARRAALESNLKDTIGKWQTELQQPITAERRAQLDTAIRQAEAELAALGGPMPDFLAGARQSVDASLTEANQRIDGALKAWTDTADAQAAETQAAAQTALAGAMSGLAGVGTGGAAELADSLADARRQLASGVAQAATEQAAAAAKAKAGRNAGVDQELPVAAATATGSKIAGTFSGWAAGQQFGGASIQAQQLAEVKRGNQILHEMNRIHLETQNMMRRLGAATYT